MFLQIVGAVLTCFHVSAATPLFASGAAESFDLSDSKTLKPPQVIVLNDDAMQTSLATVVAKALDFPATNNGLVLKLERLDFTPYNSTKNITTPADRLHLRAHVSGRAFDLEPTISKADFVGGKIITVKFPEETNDASVATLESSGTLTIKYQPFNDTLEISHGEGSVSYESKLGFSGKRHVVFAAQGIHVRK